MRLCPTFCIFLFAIELSEKSFTVPSSYPRPTSDKSHIFLEETDASLPTDAQLKNNTRYIYFRKIALGGKCLIQSCKDMHLGRTVCHKTLRPEFADDPEEQKAFLREARVTAMLQHPNTAPVYEVGFDSKMHYYFTMKLVRGATLREVLDGLMNGDPALQKAWDLHRLIDVVIQVGQVLSYAHVHGVVHCDVKPENIVTGGYGEVLLLDWGLASLRSKDGPGTLARAEDVDDVNSLRSKDSHPGTPQYMSPEQIAGDELDHSTDIYSLGAILFEVLTMQQLAWGETLDEMLQNKVNNPPPTPSIVAADRDIPSALETLCLRCIQREPERRIKTMLKLIHELLYWLRLDARHRPV
ncbi:Serine/threonine-protein kinase PknB [Fuerstiella marisgermanici]|uniref:Serine/threonine-protein kinase PknB n=1 Tax=Fuerstiella marisgermanici TaxID=1891926 RepID=A0A1P8WDG2_9PLAN|nr:Serine/threonine-protein kinase PknB [Fuerstiella marisgermanici]